MFYSSNVLYKVGAAVLLSRNLIKLVDHVIVCAIYSQNDYRGSCCLCLKPWIQLSPRIIQNYVINNYPQHNVPIVYNSAVHPVRPVLSVNHLPNTHQKY